MGFFTIIFNNIWCVRMQNKFESAVRSGDQVTYMNLMTEGITRSLKGALSSRQHAYLQQATETDRQFVKNRLTAAFRRGLNRDSAVPLSLSNALDEVIREAAQIAKAWRMTS